MFRFLGVWTKHDNLHVTMEAWHESIQDCPLYIFGEKLARLEYASQRWNKNIFGRVVQNVKIFEDRILACEMAIEQDSSSRIELNYTLQSVAEAKFLHHMKLEEEL